MIATEPVTSRGYAGFLPPHRTTGTACQPSRSKAHAWRWMEIPKNREGMNYEPADPFGDASQA